MTASEVRVPSPVSDRREGLLGRLGRSTSGGNGHSLRPAAVSVLTDLRRRAAASREGIWRQARAAQALHSEEDRMRLVAALLVLATLLLWILFLQA